MNISSGNDPRTTCQHEMKRRPYARDKIKSSKMPCAGNRDMTPGCDVGQEKPLVVRRISLWSTCSRMRQKRKRLTLSNALAQHLAVWPARAEACWARSNDNLVFSSTQAWSQTTHACGCRVLLGHGSHPAQEKKHLRQADTPLLPSDPTTLGWASTDATTFAFIGIKDDPEQTSPHPLHPINDEKE